MFEICFLAVTLCTPVRSITKPFHPDRYTLVHAVSAAYDGATTANSFRNCQTCEESDPAARFVLGRRPSDARMALVGAGVVVGVSMIPNRKIRHVTQVVFSVVHIGEGTANLRASANR